MKKGVQVLLMLGSLFTIAALLWVAIVDRSESKKNDPLQKARDSKEKKRLEALNVETETKEENGDEKKDLDGQG